MPIFEALRFIKYFLACGNFHVKLRDVPSEIFERKQQFYCCIVDRRISAFVDLEK